MKIIILFTAALLTISSTSCYADTDFTLEKAHKGDAKSQVNVGLWYLNGRANKKQNCDLAEEWFLKAVRQGYEGAAIWLHSMYSGVSIFCKEDKEQAKEWLTFAAGTGNPNYQWKLGQAYRDGWYEKPNIDKAMFWLQQSAKQDYAFAQRDLEKLMSKHR